MENYRHIVAGAHAETARLTRERDERIREYLEIDKWLREVVENKDLLQFLLARDEAADLCYEEGDEGDLRLYLTGAGRISVKDEDGGVDDYALVKVDRLEELDRVKWVGDEDFVGYDGRAFVCVIAGSNDVEVGDPLAWRYQDEDMFNLYDKLMFEANLAASLKLMI